MRRTTGTRGPALLLALVVVTAVSAVAAAQQIEITHFAYNGHGAEWREWLTAMAQSFEAETGIKVNVIGSGTNADWAPKLTAMIAGGTPPDVTDGHPAISGPFIEQGFFENLLPYIERDGVPIHEMPPAAVQGTTTADGRMWSLPVSIYPMVTFYNADMFAQSGLAEPAYMGEEWNWATFSEAARRFTRDTNGDGRTDVWGTYRLNWRWDMQVHQAGGQVYDRLHWPTESRWNTPEVLEGIKFLHELMAVYGVETFSGSLTMWNGRAGMTIAYGPAAIKTYLTNANFRWGMALQPKGAVSRAARVNPDGFQVLADSKNKEAAWKWVHYLTSRERQIELIKYTGRVPSLREAMLEYPNVFDNLPENWMVFIETAFDPASYAPYVVHVDALNTFVDNTLNAVWNGRMAPETAVEAIHEQAMALLRK